MNIFKTKIGVNLPKKVVTLKPVGEQTFIVIQNGNSGVYQDSIAGYLNEEITVDKEQFKNAIQNINEQTTFDVENGVLKIDMVGATIELLEVTDITLEQLPDVPEGFNILPEDFMDNFKLAASYAADTSEKRLILQTVMIKNGNMYATDSFKMIKINMDLKDLGDIAIPVDGFAGFKNVYGYWVENNVIYFTDRTYNQLAKISLIMGLLPDVERLINIETPIVGGDLKQLKTAIKLATDNGHKVIRLQENKLFAESEGKSKVEVHIDFPNKVDLSFTAEFLQQSILEEVMIKVGNGAAPIMFKKGDDITTVVLPRRIN